MGNQWKVFKLLLYGEIPVTYKLLPNFLQLPLHQQFRTFQHFSIPLSLVIMEDQLRDKQFQKVENQGMTLSEDNQNEINFYSPKVPLSLECDVRHSRRLPLQPQEICVESIESKGELLPLCEVIQTEQLYSVTSCKKSVQESSGNKVTKTKKQLPMSLIKSVESFVKDNIKSVIEQITSNSYNHPDGQNIHSSQDDVYHNEEKKDARRNRKSEVSFRNMELASSPESTKDFVTAEKEKTSKKLGKKSRRKSQSLKAENEVAQKVKSTRRRPNYFVAIQVDDSQIKETATKIQTGIQEASGQDLSPLIIASETFHITLMVMHLANEDDVNRASKCLDRCVPTIEITQGDLPIVLEFEKLSGFSGGRVIFASLRDTGVGTLQTMSDEVKKQMKECNVEDTDPESKPFRPHLTLWKYRWTPKSMTIGPNKIEKEWYKDFIDEYFGSQTVKSLQLCKMDEKRDDGYYFVDHEVPFTLGH